MPFELPKLPSTQGQKTMADAVGEARREDWEATAREQEQAASINSQQFSSPYKAHSRAREPMLQHFTYSHLPPHLQGISEPFCLLANLIAETLPVNPERTVALRKLLEAKDCAVRAVLYR